MTSATLSVDGRLDYFQHRMGAEAVPGIILDSPFDHSSQMKLCIARGIPEPDTPGFEKTLPRWIMKSIERSGGKALVLFTSTALMRSVAAALDMELRQAGISLLVQGSDQPRHALLAEFKRDIHSVLFGLDSFWMGVDVPGEALEHVIITRLPFAVPNHPLIEARLESIAHRGGNSFMEYTLPEAVLKFRQGAGRLLRSRRDKGLVTILDSRILTKRYGKIFLSSLPSCPVEITNSKGEVEEVFPEDW
jgi:ATP-dependent DNA helicase DinG